MTIAMSWPTATVLVFVVIGIVAVTVLGGRK